MILTYGIAIFCLTAWIQAMSVHLRNNLGATPDFIDKQVQQMLQAGVVEPSSSPWSSNVVLAKKSDGR